MGWARSNIFQWDNWQWQDDRTKRKTWYTITIIHGPNRTITKNIHFILENIQSYLTGIKDVMLDKNLHTKNTIIAYHSGAKYCERIAAAKYTCIMPYTLTNEKTQTASHIITTQKHAKLKTNQNANMQ